MSDTTSGSIDPTIFDSNSLFDAAEFLAKRGKRERVNIDYTKLGACLEGWRATHGWRPSSMKSVLLATNPASDGQRRFIAILRQAGFTPDEIHYRDAFVSTPPGISPSEVSAEAMVESLAARISYILGLVARHDDVQVLVVSHAFELYGPLCDLARRFPKGKVGLAYFRSLLDYRWRPIVREDQIQSAGIQFMDLEPFARDLFGVDTFDSSAPPSAQSSLSIW
jgi:hypothetical protein